MRAEYRERERERTAAEEQRIAAFAREQAQRDQERRAVKSAQNEYREHLQQQVVALPLLLHIDAAASAPAITHFTVPDMTYNVFGGTLNLAQFNRARHLYKNISMLFLFPVKDGKLSTGVIAIFNASCYG